MNAIKPFQRKTVITCSAVVVAMSAGAYAYENVVVRPFPFFDVTYVEKEGDFNAPPDRLPIKVSPDRLDEARIPSWLKKEIERKRHAGLMEQVLFATDVTREIQSRSKGSDVRSKNDIFSDDEKFQAICSESSKIFASVVSLFGIPSRVVWMEGHTVSEVWNGEKWVLVDTYGNVTASDKNGNMLSLLEVVKNYPDVTFRLVSNVTSESLADYTRDGYLKNKKNVYRQQPLFFVVDSDHLFDFHKNTSEPLRVLQSLLDLEDESIGYGLQYVGEGQPPVGNVGLNIFRRF